MLPLLAGNPSTEVGDGDVDDLVVAARDLGKLRTWAQALAAALGGFAAAGAWDDSVGWWALVVALVLTWVSGLDYARAAPRLLRGAA